MGILGNIFSKIFGQKEAPAAAPAVPYSAPTPTGAPIPPEAFTKQPVDVEQVLSGLAAKAPERLNWRESIVDLLKLLKLDSRLGARKELAQELHYDGDTNDTARMNVWLQGQVMRKLAENGGRVPAELRG